MAQTSVLKAEARDRVGKGAARAVRREDKVPAVIYGDKKPPIPISLNQREMTHRLHAGGFLTHLVEIEVGGEKIRVIPKDYQLDPVRDFLIHVDFLRVGEGAQADARRAGALHQPRGFAGPEARRRAERRAPRGRDGRAGRRHSRVRDRRPRRPRHRRLASISPPSRCRKASRPTITDRDFTVATIAGAAAVRRRPRRALPRPLRGAPKARPRPRARPSAEGDERPRRRPRTKARARARASDSAGR